MTQMYVYQNYVSQLKILTPCEWKIFFYDSGPDKSNALPSSSLHKQLDDDSDDPPAWEDSDDERIRISLVSIPRLRKLRTTADEDVIDGKEYIRRLRKQ